MLDDRGAERVPLAPAREEENAQLRGEPFGFARPVVHDRGGTDDEARPAARVGRAQMGEPGERLHGLPEPHVVGQDGADAERGGVGQEIEAALLIRAERGAEAGRGRGLGEAAELGDPAAELGHGAERLAIGTEPLERVERLGPRAGELPERQPLRPRARLDAEVCEQLRRVVVARGQLAIDPAAGELDEAGGGATERREVGGSERQALRLPLGGDREPVGAARLDAEPRRDAPRPVEQPADRLRAVEGHARGALGPRVRERLHAAAPERERPAGGRRGRGRGPEALEPRDRRRHGVRIRLVDPRIVDGMRSGSGGRDRDLGSDGRVASRVAGRGARPAVRHRQLEHDAVRGRRLARPPGTGVREEPEMQAVVRAEVERQRRSGGVDARVRAERVPEVREPRAEAPEEREALGGAEEKSPALAHAVEEVSRRLTDDGREDPAVQHEARVRGKALAPRQVERLV